MSTSVVVNPLVLCHCAKKQSHDNISKDLLAVGTLVQQLLLLSSFTCLHADTKCCRCKPVHKTAVAASSDCTCEHSPPQDFLDGTAPGRRCDLPVKLLERGCEAEFIEQSEVKVEVNATVSSTQVSPRDISVTLRPGRRRGWGGLFFFFLIPCDESAEGSVIK